MKKYCLLFCLISGIACAFEGSFSLDSEGVSSVNHSPSLYNFSDELLKATEECSSYQEDFTKNNPDVVEVGKVFGGEMAVYVDIKGQQEDKCIFDVLMQVGMLGKQIYHCEISSEQQKTLLAAMKDRSNELFTETYETYMYLEDDNGEILQKFPQETTVTDNRFNIEWGKVVAQNCKMEQVEISENEVQEMKEEFENLPNKFVESAQNCVSDSASRSFLFFQDEIFVKGWLGDKCVLENKDFTLRVPQQKLSEIKSWEDIWNLIKDKDISQYHYKNHYDNQGLLFALNRCVHQSGSNSSSSMAYGDNIAIKTSLAYEQKADGCALKFVNILERDGFKEDYSVTCQLSEKQVQDILQQYAELLDKYGEKASQDEGSFLFKSAEFNESTQDADNEIMAFLRENNLCHLVQTTESQKTSENSYIR